MPYLKAVVQVSATTDKAKQGLTTHFQGSMRLWPPTAFNLQQILAPAGLTIADRHITAGVLVGCNPFVVHRNDNVYGSSANEFRPEMWLDGSAPSTAQSSYIPLGLGNRACIGKHTALVASNLANCSNHRRLTMNLGAL